MSARPELSLAIPVYNGAQAGIGSLIENLLRDPFDRIEVIVSDNGSTDATSDILADLDGTDPRLQIHRFATNQGIQANFNKVLQLSRGTYFKWCAAGDLILPGYLERMVTHLRASPTTTVAHCVFDFTDGTQRMERGTHWRRAFDRRIIDATTHRLAAVRVRGNFRFYGYGGHFFGVHRRALVERLGGHAEYAGTDRVLTSELAALGPFHWDPDVLWSCYCPPVEKADYVEDGLIDGDDYPDIEKIFLHRNRFAELRTPQAASIRALLGSERFAIRIRQGIVWRVQERHWSPQRAASRR